MAFDISKTRYRLNISDLSSTQLGDVIDLAADHDELSVLTTYADRLSGTHQVTLLATTARALSEAVSQVEEGMKSFPPTPAPTRRQRYREMLHGAPLVWFGGAMIFLVTFLLVN